jgi:hypothetical protein
VALTSKDRIHAENASEKYNASNYLVYCRSFGKSCSAATTSDHQQQGKLELVLQVVNDPHAHPLAAVGFPVNSLDDKWYRRYLQFLRLLGLARSGCIHLDTVVGQV